MRCAKVAILSHTTKFLLFFLSDMNVNPIKELHLQKLSKQ
jgi:hypothetical protein